MLTSSLLNIIAAIFGLTHIEFGYQLHATCIETVILEVTFVVLLLLDINQIRKEEWRQKYLDPAFQKVEVRIDRHNFENVDSQQKELQRKRIDFWE